MNAGPFYQGTIPGSALVIVVRDAATGEPKDLTNFTGAQLLLEAPDGTSVDTSGGSALIEDAAAGRVAYAWPATSLFAQAGDYRFQLVLTNATAAEHTGIGSFEVYEPVGGNA